MWLLFNAKKVVVLVVLYSCANLLSYFALARVDASIYTVLTQVIQQFSLICTFHSQYIDRMYSYYQFLSQLKILTTAGFAVLILKRNISLTKWRALFLLVLSCVLVASPTYNIPADNECSTDVEDTSKYHNGNHEANFGAQMMGVGAILLMTLTSGFSAIYFESVLKSTGEKVTIWERNFQLAFFSISLLLLIRMWGYFFSDSDSTADVHIFHGWSFVTVLVAVIAAAGGLLVAATLKYADAILKTLATAGSIVLATILGNLLLADYVDVFVLLGCVCTILAIVNYTFE